MPLDDPHNPLAIELRQEMAASYFVACGKMVDSLETLKAFDRSSASSTHDLQRTTHRLELVAVAAERVYFVIIQREAMQLPHHEGFFEVYEVPDEVRTRLGPRRWKYLSLFEKS